MTKAPSAVEREHQIDIATGNDAICPVEVSTKFVATAPGVPHPEFTGAQDAPASWKIWGALVDAQCVSTMHTARRLTREPPFCPKHQRFLSIDMRCFSVVWRCKEEK